jgi:hypothetical protein
MKLVAQLQSKKSCDEIFKRVKMVKIEIEIEVVVDNHYPSSHLCVPLVEDQDGYVWEGTPYIAINEQQISELALLFSISFEAAKEIIIAHELGHYALFKQGKDYTNEEAAWAAAPQTSVCPTLVYEIKEYCLKTYS